MERRIQCQTWSARTHTLCDTPQNMSGMPHSSERVQTIGNTLDPNEDAVRSIHSYHEGDVESGERRAYLYDDSAGRRVCNHEHAEAVLRDWVQTRDISAHLCPLCDKGVSADSAVSTVIAHPPAQPTFTLDTFDELYFSAFNKPRDWKAPQFLTPEFLYGTHEDVVVSETQYFHGKYADFGIRGKFKNEEGEEPSGDFTIAYDEWRPRVIPAGAKLPVLILTHGVPMNRREWNEIARILGRFMYVRTYDLLGMGESSKPLDFVPGKDDPRSPDGNPDSHWSWTLQARICQAMIKHWRHTNPEQFLFNGKAFFAANDWGAGVVQKAAELFSEDLMGAGIFSAIAFDGYWVQQIGSLEALGILPYPSPAFTAETVRFAGVVTGLLETMFHRTAEHTNQYSLAPIQETFVEISYSDVNKNPGNTKYKEHPVRVLAQQASAALGNGELMSYDPHTNPKGLRFSRWDTHVLVLWGVLDKMMPEAQRHRFTALVEHLREFKTKLGLGIENLSIHECGFESAGHFAIRDRPIASAHEILKWVRKRVGPSNLAVPYIGLEGIARQDEKRVLADLEEAYKTLREVGRR